LPKQKHGKDSYLSFNGCFAENLKDLKAAHFFAKALLKVTKTPPDTFADFWENHA
jgi:hypothetical protein